MPKNEKKEINYGANQGEKIITVNKDKAKNWEINLSKKSKIEALAPGMILRNPRSYEKDRLEQTLRHIATTIKTILERSEVDGYQEVQVGVKKDTEEIYISTNTNHANNKLRKIIQDNTTIEDLVEFTKAVGGSWEPKYKGKYEKRERRHVNKFRARAPARLGNYRIKIPENVVKKIQGGLHAERRIKESSPDSDWTIKGIKRPCAHCFTAMNPNHTEDGVGQGAGPRWLSPAATQGIDRPATGITRATKTLENGVTWDHDTESESELDDEGEGILMDKIDSYANHDDLTINAYNNNNNNNEPTHHMKLRKRERNETTNTNPLTLKKEKLDLAPQEDIKDTLLSLPGFSGDFLG